MVTFRMALLMNKWTKNIVMDDGNMDEDRLVSDDNDNTRNL